MCSLRRTASVPASLGWPAGLSPRVPAPEVRQRSCTLEAPTRPSSTGSPGVSRLWVSPGQCGKGQEEEEEDESCFLSLLRRALAAGENIAVTYDFRSCMPDSDFIRGLADFCQEHLEQWGSRVVSAALLVQENVLEAAVHGPVAQFLRACPCPPGCPFVVCHSALMVEEFFQACLCPEKLVPSSGAQFLSVVEVLDDPRRRPSHWSSCHKGRACLASLAPSPSLAEAGTQAQMLHVLPNGDTRVIQSPPQDVVVRTDSRRTIKECECEWSVDEDVKLLASLPGDGLEDLTTLAALAFECPREDLQQIVGAHFHVGELAVDAETESLVRGSWRDRQQSCGHMSTPGLDAACAEGIAALVSEGMRALALGLKPIVECGGLQRLFPASRKRA